MKCQLLSTLDAGRRARGISAYPEIWLRAASRYVRWYLWLAGHVLLGKGTTAEVGQVSCADAGERRLKPGDWVRVKSRSEIENLRPESDISDVVAFIPAPMSRYCGQTMRVLRILEHYYDEVREGLCRAENAVLLEGATCDSSQLGGRHCDRGCLHFWKESWLERVSKPPPISGIAPKQESVALAMAPATSRQASPNVGPGSYGFMAGTAVRVLDLPSIEKTLDTRGVCEGVPFIPEHMTAYCGRIFIVSKKITHFFDEKADYMIRLPQAYLLSGVRCNGRQTGGEAQCDRGCILVWHQAWLEQAPLDPVRNPDVMQEDI